MRMRWLPLLVLAGSFFGASLFAQKMSNIDRDRALQILDLSVKDVKKHYYDPRLRGFDIDARAKEARTRIENVQSLGQAFALIGWTLDGLNDSHTYFLPPARTLRTDYGWRMQLIGEKCLVTGVKPKTDAESKGLKPGDEVISVDGFVPTRGVYEKLEYLLYLLRPMPVLHLQIRSPEGSQRSLDVLSKQRAESVAYKYTDIWQMVREAESQEERNRPAYYEMGDDVLIFKPKSFLLADNQMNQVLAALHRKKALLFDLRGNGGGAVEVLARLLGDFFDHEVKIGDRVGREQRKAMVTKAPKEPFTGKVVVMIDSQSASAAELFARVIQLEKRGTVIGDRSGGFVMEARIYDNEPGGVWFATVITDADILMTDGKSLEGHGVEPDELVVPTAQDLAAGRDPVLSRGAALVGLKIPPEKAGTMFPYKWPKD